MLNLIYLTETSDSTLEQIKRAGFDGYIAYGPYRAEIPFGTKFEYYDEPEAIIEGHQDRYFMFRDATEGKNRLVTYGTNIESTKERGLFHTDYTYIAMFDYPIKRSWWSTQWKLYIQMPQKIRIFKAATPNNKVIGVIQAFGRHKNWRMPSKRQLEVMKRNWQDVMGDRLVGFAYFAWENTDEPTWDTLKSHPYLWPIY